MRIHPTLLALSLVVSPACTAAGDTQQDVAARHEPAPPEGENPMASFARFVGGAWRVTFASGQAARHSWHWGPGKRSMHRLDEGQSDASGSAESGWGGEVLYWHPDLNQVRVLSMHPEIPGVGRGVGEGTTWFEGETSMALIDLDQPRGRRKLGLRQVFDGPDRYHELLLEDGGAGLQPLNALDFVREPERPAPSPGASRTPPGIPEGWKSVEVLVGSWEATADAADGAVRIRTTIEWLPSFEAVLVRSSSVDERGQATPWLEAYVFRNVRDETLRCLALSDRGGVREGVASVLEGGAWQLELKGHESGEAVEQVARVELGGDGRLRTRLWSLQDGARRLALDVMHGRPEPAREREDAGAAPR